MEEIFAFLLGSSLLNLIGGTLRYFYGSLWRTVCNKPKFTYKQYLYGVKSKDFWDDMHQENNKWIGGAFIMAVVILLVKYS